MQNYTIDILKTPILTSQPADCGQFGCCPYTNTPKTDTEGSNCKNVAGSILYSTVSALPTNEEGNRLWNLTLTGYFKPGVSKYYIVYNFSNVNYDKQVTFEDITSGTFTVCGHVLDASKIIGNNYNYSDATSLVTFVIDTSRWGFRLKKTVLFSYDILLNDCCCAPCESSTATTSTVNNIFYINNIPTSTLSTSYTLNAGDTFIIIVSDIGIGITNNNGKPDYEGYYYNSCGWHKIDYPLYSPSSLPTVGNDETITVKNNGEFCGQSYTIQNINWIPGANSTLIFK